MSRYSEHRHYRRERDLVTAVAVCFTLMLVFLLASRIITEVQSRKIQREASSIGQNALVAAEELIAIRTSLRKVVFTMKALGANITPDLVSQLEGELQSSREEMAASWAHYISVPFYPGERSLVDAVKPHLTNTEDAIEGVIGRLHEGDLEGALRVADVDALPSIARLDSGIARNLELNRHEAQMAAMRITASSRRRGLTPEIVGAFFAIASAYLGVQLLVRYLAWAAERSAELEEFTGRVAHDIRSPLGSVSLTLHMLQRSTDVDSKTRALLARVDRTMEHVKQLIDDLLVFATAGGHIVPGEWGERKAIVRDVLDGVVEDATLEAGTKGIQLRYERPDPGVIVACSPGVLISITTNLISNAIKFMGDASLRRISITAREVRRDVRLEVSDTGPGLIPELREKVFQKHVRGTSSAPGFGLGLSTVKKLAAAHGGNVGVEASPEGGCLFCVRLPIWKSSPRYSARTGS